MGSGGVDAMVSRCVGVTGLWWKDSAPAGLEVVYIVILLVV